MEMESSYQFGGGDGTSGGHGDRSGQQQQLIVTEKWIYNKTVNRKRWIRFTFMAATARDCSGFTGKCSARVINSIKSISGSPFFLREWPWDEILPRISSFLGQNCFSETIPAKVIGLQTIPFIYCIKI